MINNNSFLQSLSNITQIKIIKPKNIETTSLGVAYLAGLNAGLIKDINEITKLWKKSKIAKPKVSKKLVQKEIKNWKKTVKNLILLNSLFIVLSHNILCFFELFVYFLSFNA